eukprot:6188871-Pleurochrysis_carterae.AAC.1
MRDTSAQAAPTSKLSMPFKVIPNATITCAKTCGAAQEKAPADSSMSEPRLVARQRATRDHAKSMRKTGCSASWDGLGSTGHGLKFAWPLH